MSSGAQIRQFRQSFAGKAHLGFSRQHISSGSHFRPKTGWRQMAYGVTTMRCEVPLHVVLAPPSPGCRFRGSRRQGRQISDYNASRISQNATSGTVQEGQDVTRKRLDRWMGQCSFAKGPGSQIPQRVERLALAVGLPATKPVEEHENRRRRKASYT